MKQIRFLFAIFWAVFVVTGILAQDTQDEEDLPVIPYFQSESFNVPVLQGWEDQSTEDFAQFYNAEALATIRTAIVPSSDAVSGAQLDLSAFLDNVELDEPIYNEKVNLADGTWAVLVFRVDEDTTASLMSRQDAERTYVVSFIENNPDAEIIMVALERADDSPDGDPSLEIELALETFTDETADNDSTKESVILPSGEWQLQTYEDTSVMGFIFGNDTYIALARGDVENLPELADAYNSTVLGFFVTPDNSAYLILGVVVSIAVLAILILSIYWRSRGLKQDLALIEQLAQDE